MAHLRTLFTVKFGLQFVPIFLVAIAKKKLKIGQSLYSFLQVISISIFEKEPVNQFVSYSASHFKDSNFSNQLIIF
jgi:hypothetical protein